MMLRRNLIHTGVTCGKRLAVLVGQRKAIGIAVRSAEGGRRWSKLRELLEGVILGDQIQEVALIIFCPSTNLALRIMDRTGEHFVMRPCGGAVATAVSSRRETDGTL